MSDEMQEDAVIGLQPLSIEQLEAGLRILETSDVDLKRFWDRNIYAFRQTVLFAIRETSDSLLSPAITRHWQIEFESQLELLVSYLQLADRYIARRFFSCARPVAKPPRLRLQMH